jgi:hypothetical protein
MADFFYDGQLRRYVTQFIRAMSNFSYKDAKGVITQVPARYGDMSRQVAQILNKNSENAMPSAPFISCYIKELKFDRPRMQDPTFVSKVNIREREYDAQGQEYLNTQGANYTVERIMPTPYMLTFAADIWTSNTDQKFQIVEQIASIFNPSLELQTTNNYIDWTSLSVLELTDQGTFSSRQIPQGVDQNIDIMNMVFTAPIWITPPAKVKQLGIITKIISNVFVLPDGTVNSEYADLNGVDDFGSAATTVVVTPGDFDLLVLDNVATLLTYKFTEQDATIDVGDPRNASSWFNILDLYPGQFTAGLSQLRLTTPAGNEIIARISLDPNNETRMVLNIDQDTVPTNTIINSVSGLTDRGTVDAIVNPDTFNPGTPTAGIRYLILENIDSVNAVGPAAWLNSDGSGFTARANDIIEWSGSAWTIVFNSALVTDVVYITNSYTGVQYKWDGAAWTKSFEGVYDKAAWRLIL